MDRPGRRRPRPPPSPGCGPPGYPAALQRAIIGALITDRFADRRKALADLISAHAWWRNNLYGSSDGAKIIAMRQKIFRDEKDMREQLLGPDTARSDLVRAQQLRQFGDLPAAKMSELARISSDYDELINEVRTDSQGILLPEDRAKLAYLEQEKRADVVKLLSPEELLAFDMRSSPTAQQLKYQLSAFKPTEEEYRAIFPIAQAFDAQYNGGNVDTHDARRNASSATRRWPGSSRILPGRSSRPSAPPSSRRRPMAALHPDQRPGHAAPAARHRHGRDRRDPEGLLRAGRRDPFRQKPHARPAYAPMYNALGTQAAGQLAPALGGDAGVAAYKQTGAGNWLANLTRPAPAAETAH